MGQSGTVLGGLPVKEPLKGMTAMAGPVIARRGSTVRHDEVNSPQLSHIQISQNCGSVTVVKASTHSCFSPLAPNITLPHHGADKKVFFDVISV
jgi:hypothetical protein